MEIVTLQSARENGLVRYFTGMPCSRGHIAERAASNKTCLECHKRAQKQVYERHGEKIRSRVREYGTKNKTAIAIKDKAYQLLNRERLCRYYAERYQAKRDVIAEKVRAYRKARPGFSNELGKAHEMRKRKAMPGWVDRSEIRKIYAKAAEMTRETGRQYSVDHIYPLKGRNSCGLHVPWNLQIILKIENCRKATKMPEEWAA